MHIKHDLTKKSNASDWTAFPYMGEYMFDVETVKKDWFRLHMGDVEPLPQDKEVLAAWALFHSGEFQQAYQLGLQLGNAGTTVANKASCIYANYLEPKESVKQGIFRDVAARAEQQIKADPSNPNAYYWQAYALGRYGQGISIAKALAQGLGGKVKAALENTIALQPQHADAYIALGTFHAEVIDKVGALIGSMTYGVKKETSLKLFQQAMSLNPRSAIVLIEKANAIVMLEGEQRMDEATQLYEAAAKGQAFDALERLHAELATAELMD